MKYRTRTYYTDAQKAMMWERWKQGWTLHQIAHLFDRAHGSIRGIFERTGGFRPQQRRRSPIALTLAEILAERRRNPQDDLNPALGRRMGAHVLYLLVDGRLRDFAFLDVLHQAAVPSHKTDVEFLFRFVPLAANHHAIAVSIRLRAGEHRRDDVAGDFPDPFE